MIKILIVDDIASTRNLLSSYFDLIEDITIIAEAKNGQEAISEYILWNENIDIILMDYMMPLKDGIEASKEILKINSNAKILFVSANNEIEQEAKYIGASGFLAKPFKLEKLLYKIRKIVYAVNSCDM